MSNKEKLPNGWDWYHNYTTGNEHESLTEYEFKGLMKIGETEREFNHCLKLGPDGLFLCNRKLDHKGQHIAFGSETVCAIWGDVEVEPKKPDMRTNREKKTFKVTVRHYLRQDFTLKISFFYDLDRGQTLCAISEDDTYLGCGISNLNPREIDNHNNLEGAKVALTRALMDCQFIEKETNHAVWNGFFQKYPEAKR